ncbi:MAG: response regulator [Myxococcales bacterium]|nr:response regulator [Myxococcales bacterium]
MTASPPAPCPRVLFVDDEVGVLEALRHAVLDQAWDFASACSGPEALRELEVAPAAVIVSDYRMPGMSGVELLRAVRERHPETVRIVLSGYAEAHAIVAAINEGHVERFLPKPWDDDELVAAIRSGVSKYELEMANAQLSRALRANNEALREANETLERRVRERTAELEMHNRALQFSQEMLDRLPYALFGLDATRRIVTMNARARALEGAALPPTLGSDAERLLPSEAMQLVGEVLRTGRGDHRRVVSMARTLHADCEPIGDEGVRGVVLVLRWQESEECR